MLNCGEGGNPIDCGTTVGKAYFSPRLGLAYRASHSMVVRAGFGMTYEPFNIIDDLRTNYPILIPLNETNPNSLTAAGVLDTASLQNTPGGECAKYPSFCFGAGGTLPVGILNPSIPSLTAASNPIPGNVNLVTSTGTVNRGYIMSWNLSIEKELAGGWVAQAGYVATRTVNQLGQLDLNVESPIAPAGCDPTAGNCGGSASRLLNYNGGNSAICTSTASSALGCRTGGTTIITPTGDAHYNSLQSTLSHRWANGLDVRIAYTWSKTVSEAATSGGAGGFDEKGHNLIQVPQFYSLNRGLAPSDRPQNFEATFVWQPPFGAGRQFANSGVSSKILGGWQLSGIVTSVSNTPFELQASNSSLGTGDTQRPDRLCNTPIFTKQIGPRQQWFEPNCFSGVDTQRYGTSAFYQFHGPHQAGIDAAIFRSFKLSERFSLQFRAQAFNLTNTPVFSNPGDNCGSIPTGATTGCNSSSFGQVTGTSNFGRHTGESRLVEFNAKLSF